MAKIRVHRSLQGGPKMAPFLDALTSSNINRFSKLFHSQNQEKICDNTITKDPTTSQVCRYTTLWKVKCLKSNNFENRLIFDEVKAHKNVSFFGIFTVGIEVCRARAYTVYHHQIAAHTAGDQYIGLGSINHWQRTKHRPTSLLAVFTSTAGRLVLHDSSDFMQKLSEFKVLARAGLTTVPVVPWEGAPPPPGGPRSTANFFTLFWRLNVQCV